MKEFPKDFEYFSEGGLRQKRRRCILRKEAYEKITTQFYWSKIDLETANRYIEKLNSPDTTAMEIIDIAEEFGLEYSELVSFLSEDSNYGYDLKQAHDILKEWSAGKDIAGLAKRLFGPRKGRMPSQRMHRFIILAENLGIEKERFLDEVLKRTYGNK